MVVVTRYRYSAANLSNRHTATRTHMNSAYETIKIVPNNGKIAGTTAIIAAEVETAQRSEQVNVVQKRLTMVGLFEKR